MKPEHRKRLAVGAILVAAVIGWILYQRSTGLGTLGSLQELIDTARGAWWALPAFVALYAFRPPFLLPASLLTIAGGLLFGPVLGVTATVIGANASAMVGYWIARSFGIEKLADTDDEGRINRWTERLRNESFVTVFLMRLAFLPYDLVHYAAGALKINPLSFLLATALGSLPGTVSFTLAGASIESLEDGPSGVDPVVLLASAGLFVVSVSVSRLVKRRAPEAMTA